MFAGVGGVSFCGEDQGEARQGGKAGEQGEGGAFQGGVEEGQVDEGGVEGGVVQERHELRPVADGFDREGGEAAEGGPVHQGARVVGVARGVVEVQVAQGGEAGEGRGRDDVIVGSPDLEDQLW